MKTTERFDKAVTKLYNAFHANELNAMDCCACAVGNMCDNSSHWSEEKCGYSMVEIENIERIFMEGEIPDTGGMKWYTSSNQKKRGNDRGWDAREVHSRRNKELVFDAMIKVIEYLCELDNIPNVMDFTKLFEYDKENHPIHQL